MNNYTIHADRAVAIGTSLKGFMVATKADIISKLGNPHDGGDKVYDEWIVTCEGTVLTIYDCDLRHRLHSDTKYYWHIGGTDDACSLANQIFPEFRHLGCREGVYEQAAAAGLFRLDAPA